MILLPARLQPFAKAVFAVLSGCVALISTAVAAASPHTIGAIATPGWLVIGAGTLAIGGTVLGVSNVPSSTGPGLTITGMQIRGPNSANLPPNMTAMGNLPDPSEPAPASKAVRKRTGRR